MNHLVAKIKDKKDDVYKKVLSGEAIYKTPEGLSGAKKYDPGYHLEDDEWFMIEGFSETQFCIEFLKTPFSSVDYSLLSSADPKNIEYLCSYQNQNEYYFQRVLKSNILTRRSICFGDEIKMEEARKSILLNEVPDALYMKNKDILYFRKLETIAPIFNGIDMLYREATKEETIEFFDNEFITPSEKYRADEVGKANRKRIAMVMDTLKRFNKADKRKVLDYTHMYYPALKYEQGKFNVSTDEELKYLLWGIEQRYYTTPITREKRVANSVSRLDWG